MQVFIQARPYSNDEEPHWIVYNKLYPMLHWLSTNPVTSGKSDIASKEREREGESDIGSMCACYACVLLPFQQEGYSNNSFCLLNLKTVKTCF